MDFTLEPWPASGFVAGPSDADPGREGGVLGAAGSRGQGGQNYGKFHD
jgi:hypothetical protein